MTVTGANPWIENLRVITDTVTKRFVNCTAKQIDAGYAWRTGITDATGADGGYDTVPGRNFLKPRQISCTLIKVYDLTVPESFKTATRDMERVLNPGNPLTLTFVEDDGTIWDWDVRVMSYDKAHSMNWKGYMEFPITFIAPDPRQRARYKPGILLLDDGLLLDNGWNLDNDPDIFAITATLQNQIIANNGNAPDEAPIVSLQGPLTGPIYVNYYDGNQSPALFLFQWKYNLNIAANETVTVDPTQPEVTSSLANVDAYHNFVPPTNTRSWGIILVGTTIVQFSCQGFAAPASGAVQWWPRK